MSIVFCEHASPHRVCTASLGTTAPTHTQCEIGATSTVLLLVAPPSCRPCGRGAPQVLPCRPPLARRDRPVGSARLRTAPPFCLPLQRAKARHSGLCTLWWARTALRCGPVTQRASKVRRSDYRAGRPRAHARTRSLTQADGCPVGTIADERRQQQPGHSSEPREAAEAAAERSCDESSRCITRRH